MYRDAEKLVRGDKFVYEGRVYKAHSADKYRDRVFVETTTGTLITVRSGDTFQVA